VSSFFNDHGLRAVAVAQAVATAGGALRYGPYDGRFWVYRDGVWVPDAREVRRRLVRVLGDRYRPGHAHAVSDVLAAQLDELHVQPNTSLINFSNTMVDWAADGLPRDVPHDPSHLSTVQLPVAWAPGETRCDEFDAFLEGAVAADDRTRVWEILGYLMMSGNPLQRLFLFTGGGGNGKGVLLAVITRLLGRANTSAVALNEFADDPFASADVYGRLANVCGDIDTTFIQKTGLIKKLAGEDLIRAQHKYGHPFEFEFWGKALFSANGIPTAADSSQGWLRRWEIVNFPNEPARPDRGLKARLCQDASIQAIAVRAVLALRELMDRGTFDHGDSATEAHAEFAKRNNKLLAWIDDEGYFDPSMWYPREVLLRSFRWWDTAQNPGGRSISASTFYERLHQIKGLRAAKIRGTRGIRGLRLNSDAHQVDGTDTDVPPGEGADAVFEDQLPFELGKHDR
jgi:putative DNA primase/helicase